MYKVKILINSVIGAYINVYKINKIDVIIIILQY